MKNSKFGGGALSILYDADSDSLCKSHPNFAWKEIEMILVMGSFPGFVSSFLHVSSQITKLQIVISTYSWIKGISEETHGNFSSLNLWFLHYHLFNYYMPSSRCMCKIVQVSRHSLHSLFLCLLSKISWHDNYFSYGDRYQICYKKYCRDSPYDLLFCQLKRKRTHLC